MSIEMIAIFFVDTFRQFLKKDFSSYFMIFSSSLICGSLLIFVFVLIL